MPQMTSNMLHICNIQISLKFLPPYPWLFSQRNIGGSIGQVCPTVGTSRCFFLLSALIQKNATFAQPLARTEATLNECMFLWQGRYNNQKNCFLLQGSDTLLTEAQPILQMCHWEWVFFQRGGLLPDASLWLENTQTFSILTILLVHNKVNI